MSAHLTDQDCINALATFWYEYHKMPRSESPQSALERAFIIAQEEISLKKDYFDNQNELRYRAIRLIEAQQPVLHENAYISGNICLTENNTTTDYDIPYLGWFTTENAKGRMTLFPSCLPHAVDELKEEERYSLAFDLITEKGMDFFWNNNGKNCDPLLLAVEL